MGDSSFDSIEWAIQVSPTPAVIRVTAGVQARAGDSDRRSAEPD